MHKRSRGYKAEGIVAAYYLERGRKLLRQNFTIQGGEIDLICSNDTTIVFIEVKDVTYISDTINYITSKKIQHIKYAIHHYLRKYPTKLQQRFDVVFVRKQNVDTVIEDCVDF